nr:MAG TPA: hypothetical protein [Caudoviricetes sp.]
MTLSLDCGIIYLVHEHQRVAQIRAILFCYAYSSSSGK